MRWTEGAGWAALAVGSALLTLAASRPPEPPSAPPTPAPLPRPPTPAEAEAVAAALERTQLDLAAAAAELGRWPRLDELEGRLPDGRPLLPEGLPDNPLVEGTAGVAAWCGGAPSPPIDWLYCAETGALAAGSPTSRSRP